MLARRDGFVASTSTAAGAPLVGENTTTKAVAKEAANTTKATITESTTTTTETAAKTGSTATAGAATGTATGPAAGGAANDGGEVWQFSIAGDDVAASHCALLSTGDLLVVCVNDFFREHEEGGPGV